MSFVPLKGSSNAARAGIGADPPPLRISIIIPVLNSERFLGGCLESIFSMTFPRGSYEVIVVDNGSKDGSVEIAEKYGAKVLVKPGVNVSAVRNFGARASTGDVLAFVDSDCLVSKDWLANAVPYFRDPSIGMVGSLCAVNENDMTWVGKAWNSCMKKRLLRGETDRLGCGNIIIRKKCFEEINGFDDGLVTGEDDELCHKIREAGYRIYSDPAVKVYHLGEYRTLRQFFRKETWRGYETFRLFLRHSGRMNTKVTIYSGFFLANVLFFLLLLEGTLMLHRGYAALFLPIILLMSLPAFMAVSTASRTGKWGYLFHFTLLYLLFGVARGLAMLRIKL